MVEKRAGRVCRRAIQALNESGSHVETVLILDVDEPALRPRY